MQRILFCFLLLFNLGLTEVPAETEILSSQCKGLTKAGLRCKNKTSNSSGYCYLHENQINGLVNNKTKTGSASKTSKSNLSQCLGIAKAGMQCKRMTDNPTGRCYQHLN